MHEAQAASALDHPRIGTIYEINETEDGDMFIAMAYYKGVTLAFLRGRLSLSFGETKRCNRCHRFKRRITGFWTSFVSVAMGDVFFVGPIARWRRLACVVPIFLT